MDIQVYEPIKLFFHWDYYKHDDFTLKTNGLKLLQRCPALWLSISSTEADSGLVKLVVMTNVFFNKQQDEIEIKRFIFVKYIMSRFFCNS